MKKIPTLFKRDPNNAMKIIPNEYAPGTEWVAAGEGKPMQKLDGTCCMIRNRKLYKRYELKMGKTPPKGFEPVTEFDDKTGKMIGWVPVGDGPEDKWHREGLLSLEGDLADGTYELIGPKIQGNPEGVKDAHILISHNDDDLEIVADCPTDYEGLKSFLSDGVFEGIVWHHPDGRMAKIKARDFGHKRMKL